MDLGWARSRAFTATTNRKARTRQPPAKLHGPNSPEARPPTVTVGVRLSRTHEDQTPFPPLVDHAGGRGGLGRRWFNGSGRDARLPTGHVGSRELRELHRR